MFAQQIDEAVQDLLDDPPQTPDQVAERFEGLPRKQVVRAVVQALRQGRVSAEAWLQVAFLLGRGGMAPDVLDALRAIAGDPKMRILSRVCAGKALLMQAAAMRGGDVGLGVVESMVLGMIMVGDEEGLYQAMAVLGGRPDTLAMTAVICEPWRRVSEIDRSFWRRIDTASPDLQRLLSALPGLDARKLAAIMPKGFDNPIQGDDLGQLTAARMWPPDGQGAFVLAFDMAGPRNTTTIVSLVARGSEGLRDATVAVACDAEDAATLRGHLGAALPAPVDVPVNEALGLLGEVLRFGTGGDEDVLAALAMLEPFKPGDPPVRVTPAPAVDLEGALALLAHKDRTPGWFFSFGELSVPVTELAGMSPAEVSDKVTQNPAGPRLVSMARNMARYWAWAGEPEVAAGFARLAVDAERDLASSALLAAVVRRTLQTYGVSGG